MVQKKAEEERLRQEELARTEEERKRKEQQKKEAEEEKRVRGRKEKHLKALKQFKVNSRELAEYVRAHFDRARQLRSSKGEKCWCNCDCSTDSSHGKSQLKRRDDNKRLVQCVMMYYLYQNSLDKKYAIESLECTVLLSYWPD